MARVGSESIIIFMTPSKNASFGELGVAPKILGILEYHKFIEPTPIQRQAIPVALEDKDIIGIAQTGTGKTLAFGLPLIQRLAILKTKGLILLPTRELAIQVDETLKKIGNSLGLKTTVLIGGAPLQRQIKSLAQGPHIIIATPGRLSDLLKRRSLNLNQIKIVVLDEADRMLDIGFAPQIREILSQISSDRQTMLFSATMSPEIAKLAAQYQKIPLRIEVAPSGTTASQIEQEVFIVGKESKMHFLDKILQDNKGSVLVFSRTKHGAKKITLSLKNAGYSAVEIHSNRSLKQRQEALNGFKNGRYRILVATDIAARGIDVKGIALVINFDLPDDLENYVHRIGRTGRAEETGKAITFATREEKSSIRSIEKIIRKTLPILEAPILSPRLQLANDFSGGNQNNFRYKKTQRYNQSKQDHRGDRRTNYSRKKRR